MKKKILLLILTMMLQFGFISSALAEDFLAKIHRLAIDNGINYGGVKYLELIFTDVTDLSGVAYAPSFVYYAIPIEDESAFPYMFAILKYAKTRNQAVRISSQTNWIRSDGYAFGRVTYVE
jgi:hypothetical protein